MATQVTVWQDNQGNYWPTEALAKKADLKVDIANALPANQAKADVFAEVLVENWNAIKPVLIAYQQA